MEVQNVFRATPGQSFISNHLHLWLDSVETPAKVIIPQRQTIVYCAIVHAWNVLLQTQRPIVHRAIRTNT